MKKFIYALVDQETKQVRYVGWATDPIRKYRFHRYEDKTKVGEWFRKNLPVLKVFEIVRSSMAVRKRLRHFQELHKETLIQELIRLPKENLIRLLVSDYQLLILKNLAKEKSDGNISKYIRDRLFS